MNTQDILKLTEVKNQNLPKISIDSNPKKYELIYIPVFEETVKDVLKLFPSLKKHKLKGKKKESFDLVENGQILKVRGMGKKSEITARKLRRFFGQCYLGAEASKIKKIAIVIDHLDWVYFAGIGIHVAALNPEMLKPSYKAEKVPEIALISSQFKTKSTQAKKKLQEGMIVAEGKNLMRILGSIPPNSLYPEVYAKIVESLCKKWKVKCKTISKRELKKYELINAVASGSEHDAKLMLISIPVAGSKKSTVVVGKGLCYDSGGVQGKGSYMKTMKEDMSGSGSVMGTILTIVKNKLKLKQTTHFLLPLVESMMGSKAMRADDVWTAGDGQTVEIIHTDAEGRLVMADSICYAKNNIKNVDQFYTIATLTGSCVVALGEIYTGVLCNDEKLGETVTKIGKETGDHIFVGPWDLEYDDNNSPIADVANLGEKDRDAGWLKAGYFLARFVPKNKESGKHSAKFCHFDIAGSIDMHAKGASHRRKGFNSGVAVSYLSSVLTK